MVAPAIAPNVTTYASRTPYITAQEWRNAPTGVDANSIIPGAQQALEDSQLNQTIAYASSMVDIFCNQVIAATSDTQSGRYRLQRGGVLKVPCDYSPVLEVDSVQWGWDPSSLTVLTDLSNVWIDRKVIEIPIFGNGQPSIYGWPYGQPVLGSQLLVVLAYVNGYPNTITTASAEQGVTALDVDSTLGCYPGTVLTVADGENTEQVTVGIVDVGVLNLLSPLTYPHEMGVSVSNLPPAVKEATILLTSALVKTRGAEGIVMAAIRSEPNQKVDSEDGGMNDVALAKGLLAPFRRVI